jgi:hypothetical protein
MLNEGFEGIAIFLVREELVAINGAGERHRLLAQGMGDVVVIDALVMLPVSMAASSAQRHQVRISDKDIQPIVEQANS